jgi:RNA methyltransferase, TrmH family
MDAQNFCEQRYLHFGNVLAPGVEDSPAIRRCAARGGKIAPMPTASDRTRLPRIVQSRQNARVKELRAGFARPSKTEQGRIAIEGEHLLLEAVATGLHMAALFLRAGSDQILHRFELPEHTEILVLPPDVFASAVSTESPQGMAALVEPPSFVLDDILHASATPLLLISAGLQDPGNLGTLIRSAEAFGATGLITLPGTVSPWNQKALRASAGSIFRLPVIASTEEEIFTALESRGVATVATVAAHADSLTHHDLTRPTALILGNEGSGIPTEILRRASHRVTIPTPGPVESLNAAIAGSILLYEASRQRAAGRP